MTSHQGSSVIASAVLLVLAALIWLPGRQRWPRTVVVLIITGVAGLLNTTAGRYAHTGITAAADALGKLTGYLFGFTFAGIIALVAVAVVGFHLHHKAIDLKTLGCAAVVPVSAVLVPGVVGGVLIAVLGFMTTLAGSIFYFAFNGHL